jgi:3-oxoacyl-[acyl-carrier protein] reductase
MALRDKVVVVTGGSGALGGALAEFAAERGARVVIFYHSGRDRAEAIVHRIEDRNASALALQVDVADRSSVDAAVLSVLNTFGQIDVLINCAGISRNGVVWKVSDDDWSDTLDVNLTGTFQCTRAVLPAMRSRSWGRIVNIASVVGQIGVAGTSAYAASKGGMMAITRANAIEVASKGITVNALALGYFEAGIIADVPEEKLKAVIASVPVGRLGTLAELCHAVDFLCANEAAYITGQVINVNGGVHC